MDDPLKKLLEQTGWTYDDVLKRLEQYKKENVIKTSSETNSNDCDNTTSKTNSNQEIKLSDKKDDVINNEAVNKPSNDLGTAQYRRKRKVSEEESSKELLPCVVIESVAEESGYEDNCSVEVDCKRIRLSSSGNKNSDICETQLDEKIEDKSVLIDHIEECGSITSNTPDESGVLKNESDQVGSSTEQKEVTENNKLGLVTSVKSVEECILVESKSFEHNYSADYSSIEHTDMFDREEECEKNTSSGISNIVPKEECGNDDNSTRCGKITKRRKSRRKSSLSNNEFNPCCELPIQEDKRDNSFSDSSVNSMKTLTKPLNKRRKLEVTDINNQCHNISDHSEVTNLIKEDNMLCVADEIQCSKSNKYEDPADETDSNKENTDLDQGSYISIVKEEEFFNERKLKHVDVIKFKNDEFFSNCLESKKIEDLQTEQPVPDFIELLKQEVCNPVKEISDEQTVSEKSEEHSLFDNIDLTVVEKEEEKSKNNISKTLDMDNVEDECEKVKLYESSSNDGSCSNIADLNQPHRHQVLILKKKKASVQNDGSPDVRASISISQNTSLAKKESRRFNTDRLTNITNILSQKLSSINKDLDRKEETSDDDEDDQQHLKKNSYKSLSPGFDHKTIQLQKPGTSGLSNQSEDITLATSSNNMATTAESCTTPIESSIKPKDETQNKTKKSVVHAIAEKMLLLEKKNEETAIKPTKTKDVTKIKGWKKKKFAVDSPVLEDKKEAKNEALVLSKELELPSTSKSVFTSDILERYLTQNADLKISYEVPKLDAEQTLHQTYTDIKFPKRQQEVVKTTKIQEKKDKKPKTLAEKRKMEERPASQLLEDLLKIDTSATKSYATMLLKLKQKMLSENVPFSKKSFEGSSRLTNSECFIKYNNIKLKVTSNKSNKTLCKIFYKQPKPRCKKVKKLSLLQSLSNENFDYNPDEWEIVEKKLPRIYLEFIPEIGKRLHPKMSHLIESNETVLNRQRVNYALSVLKTPTPLQPKRFLFRIPFRNNQKTVSLQKKIVFNEFDVEHLDVEESIEDGVKHVVNKLLAYVEVLDETKDIVREDEDRYSEKPKEIKPKPPKTTNMLKFKEFRKTAIEMKRLNCKFVSLSTDDENTSYKSCSKDYCRLGCVCKSIEGSVSTLLQSHCGLHKCMFECKCKKEKLQCSNMFSEGIINRLQDEATKDLAKVEKEFTQTIIQTNNQLIVVGDSTERKKRIPRAPKKYDDFVEELFFDEIAPKAVAPPPQPVKPAKIIYKNQVFETCYVKLPKYDFKDILPFCMVHSLYKCHCKFGIVPTIVTTENKSSTPVPTPPVSTPQVSTPPNKQNQTESNKKTLEVEDYTSRIKPVASTYILRNKTQQHVKMLLGTSKQLERRLNKYLKKNENYIMSLDESKDSSLEDFDFSANETIVSSPSFTKSNVSKRNLKKKKHLEVNENFDSNIEEMGSISCTFSAQDKKIEKEPKIQRRRVKQSTRDSTSVLQKNDSPPENRAIQTQHTEKEFCMFLAKHSSQVRILPWSVLVSRYANGSFQLWTLNKPDAPVLLTENGKRPSNSHYNLKLFENLPRPVNLSCDIIRNIINKETPLGKSKDQVWVLFLETSQNVWRICGICDKNESKKDFSISIITLYGRLEEIIKESINSQENQSINKNKTITSTKKHYLPKRLILGDGCKDEGVEQMIWASLPNVISSCKWRVISIEKSFAHLSFSRCKYTIDFNDISKAIELSQTNKLTLALRSNELQSTYPHRKFGIYCDLHHPKKVFVGPYFAHEEHDLAFLIFKDDILLDRNTDDKTRLESDYWYRQEEQVEDEVQLIPDDTTLIDLTTDSDNELMNGYEENVLEASKEVGRQEKRYIITNVPAVGYILAFLNENSNYLDIICPITGKTKTFMHPPSAIDTLYKILLRKFILVPNTFKLEVKMVDNINTDVYKPLNSLILNGYHMVGQFGVKNASTITVMELGRLGLSTTEVYQVLEQRERKLLLLPMALLSKLLNICIPNKAPFVSSLHNIAESAKKEVERLCVVEASYTKKRLQLQDEKKSLTKRLLQLVANLPHRKRKKEQNRLHATLKSYTSRVDKISNDYTNLVKPINNEDLEHRLKCKNLFDECRVSESQNKKLPETNTIIRRSPKTIITRISKSNEIPSDANKDNSEVTQVSKGVSKSAINISLSDVNKNMKLINSTILKNKQGTSLLKQTGGVSNKVFNTTPVLSKINIPGTSTLSMSSSTQTLKSSPRIKLSAKEGESTTNSVTVVTLPSTGGISTVKIGKSTYLAQTNQQHSLKPKTGSETTNNRMATITPLLKEPIKSTVPKKNPNYIALKDGDKLRYFQLVSDEKKSLVKSPSVIKAPNKKIILSSALPKTDKKTAK